MNKFKNSLFGIILLGAFASFIANHFGVIDTINVKDVLSSKSSEQFFKSIAVAIFHPVSLLILFVILYLIFQGRNIKILFGLRRNFWLDENKTKELSQIQQYILKRNRKKSVCLLIWGRNGIGKSTLLEIVEHSFIQSIILRKLFFLPLKISNVYSISLIPRESFFEGLYRFFFFSKKDFQLNDMINQKDNIKLDFLLHIIPRNSLILIDDITKDHSDELILFFTEIKKRKLKITLVCSSDKKFEISSLPEFFVLNENAGVSPLTPPAIIRFLENESINEEYYSEILSIGDGNPGVVSELIFKLKNSNQENIDLFKLMKAEHLFEDRTIQSFIEFAAFVQSSDGVINSTLFSKLNSSFLSLFNELLSNSIIKPLDTVGNYKLDKQLELEFYKKLCQAPESKENIVFQIVNSLPFLVIEIKQIDSYIVRNLKLILNLVSTNSQIALPNEDDLLGISKLFKNSIYYREIFQSLITSDRLLKSIVHQFLLAKYNFIDAKFNESIHAIEHIIFEDSNSKYDEVKVEANIILAECLRKIGNYSKSRDVIEKLLIGKTIINAEANDQSQSILGKAYIGLGMHKSALKAFNTVISSNKKLNKVGIDDVNTYIDAYRGKNIILRDQGKYEDALSEILKIPNQLNSFYLKIPRGYVFRSISTCFKLLGNYSEADKYNLLCFEIAESLNHKPLLANCIWGKAEIFRYENRFEEAIENYKRAIYLYTELSDNQGILYSLLGLGDIYLKSENYIQCLNQYNSAEIIAKNDQCELELLYIEYGKSMLNYSKNKKVEVEKIINLSTRAYEKDILWLKNHLDLFLFFAEDSPDPNFTFDNNWLEEKKYVNRINRYRKENAAPYKIIPQKY